MNDKPSFDPIALNREIHDRIAEVYDERHVEIYNPTEQSRLRASLASLLDRVRPADHPPRVLDFGAGTGNVTRHLLELGAEVAAADVSPQSLAQLEQKTGYDANLRTIVLNGKDLADVPDASFDLAVTYSVLHHVPDYLEAVGELLRVTRSGGMLCIDHEVCPSFWTADAAYLAYLGELGQEQRETHLNLLGIDTRALVLGVRIPTRLTKAFSLEAWRRLLARKFGPALDQEGEGDIHVTLADHIDWTEIARILSPHCSDVSHDDYLVCRERGVPPAHWTRWKQRCADMRLLTARKT